MRLTTSILTTLSLILMLHGTVLAEEDQAAPQIGYWKLEKSLVTNLTGGPKYIRTEIQLMTEQAPKIPEIEVHAPALTHTYLMYISSRDGNALKTREGKEALRKGLLDETRKLLKELTGYEIVNDLYFTTYYVK